MFRTIENLKMNSKVIGFTCGTFDLLHPGHVMMLQESKSHCDYLIVGLLTDPTISRTWKVKPKQSTLERFIQLQAIDVVDMIIPFDTEDDIVRMLLMIRPNIRFVGQEYKGKAFTGCDVEGVEIFYNSRMHSFSSTELRERFIIQTKNVAPI